MRIAIIGGGPSGLTFAVMMKRRWPSLDITVFERNRADDTFGFGVVFSDQTLDTLRATDPVVYQRITEAFAYWDDIEIRFKGERRRIGGNGFCGCSRRTLLLILQERARALGVRLSFCDEVPGLAALAGYDLVVASDGINSAIRTAHADHFQPETDLRPNRFTWMGSTRPLDAFTFSFRETRFGLVVLHAYQYEAGRSTMIFETDPETFQRFGLDPDDEAGSAALMAELFAEDLEGHGLITNRSMWRRFPMIRCARWVMGNVVLLGDAKASAHFSIGSGTKLAMEDAIALAKAFEREGLDVARALARFETDRREDVEKTQHAADVSLVWFEHVKRFWHFDPVRFSFGVMTRSKAITWDNLALRAPDFVAEAATHFAQEVAASGLPADTKKPVPPMFQPFRLRDMVVANRVVVSPMDQYSAADGVPNDWHLMHLGARATGGAGLLFTEMTCVSAEGRITPGCTGLWNDEQEAAWRRIVDFVHTHSATKIALQLGHSGRKGATKLMWDGIDRPLDEGGWPIIAASPLPYFPDSPVPREMTEADMAAVTADFASATTRAARAGFDMVELHAAHGYLVAGFISPLTNQRTDAYGGSLENRLRFPLSVFRAMRAAWPAGKPMSVRLSATDWAPGGLSPEEAVAVARAFAAEGCDLIDVSTGQTVQDAAPVYGRMFQVPFSDMIRNEAGLATMCVGAITSADQVNTILAAGRADLVALARTHLVDPFFTLRAAAWYGVKGVHCPPQYHAGRDQLFRNTPREREELTELRLKARPASHRGAVAKAAQ